MKRGVVLDKNYLQGASAAEVRALAATHRLIMPGALFYELLTTDPLARRRCFAKLPPVDNPVLLVDHIGILMSRELDLRRPSGKPSGHRLQMRFRFNERLLSEDYQLPDEAALVLRAQTKDIASDVERLIALSETTPSLFPGLLSGSQQQQAAARSRAEAAISDWTRFTVSTGLWLHLRDTGPTQRSQRPSGSGPTSAGCRCCYCSRSTCMFAIVGRCASS